MAARSDGRAVIAGLILAGGLSSRMGEDKAQLRLGGVTLLQRTAEVLRSAGAGLVVISGDRPGGIPDRWPQAGPVGGIASAAAHLPDGHVLVVPVDMPHLDASVLLPILAERSHGAAYWARHPLPMRLRLDDECREVLADMMQRQGRECSVAALQSRVGATALPLDGIDTQQLVNCNTPDEWREANP